MMGISDRPTDKQAGRNIGARKMTGYGTKRVDAPKLSPSEARVLGRIRKAGTEGLGWDPMDSGTLGRLVRKGLIEYRVGPADTTKRGTRTRMRFVATSPRKSGQD
jgi:hypothetical protein